MLQPWGSGGMNDAAGALFFHSSGRALRSALRSSVRALSAISLGMLGLLAGIMIGVVGKDGVVLVPALVYFGGIPIHVAIAALMMSCVLTGLIGTLVYARRCAVRSRWS